MANTALSCVQSGEVKVQRLPTLLVMPVIEKNTFLDFDDAPTERRPRRSKTVGAQPGTPVPVELYNHSGALPLATPGSFCSSDSHTTVDDAHSTTDECQSQGTPSSQNRPSSTCMQRQDEQQSADLEAQSSDYYWTVDAKKLRGNDRSTVSRSFELDLGLPGAPRLTFKLMLCARSPYSCKGGYSFKQSDGKGNMQLKCEQELGAKCGQAIVQLSVGSSATSPHASAESRIVHHDFAQSAACTSLGWDFKKGVDEAQRSFVIGVTILASR